jgi:hypothetical protein
MAVLETKDSCLGINIRIINIGITVVGITDTGIADVAIADVTRADVAIADHPCVGNGVKWPASCDIDMLL